MLKIQFAFLPEEEESIHPFSFGNIFVETASGVVTSHEEGRCNCPFLLSALTELLYGLAELLESPRIKTYAFTPSQSDIDLVFERRKHASFALRYQNRLLDVYPESQVYRAFQEAVGSFAAQYQHRFLPSDGSDSGFDGAVKDEVEEWARAMDQFNRLNPRDTVPGTAAKMV